MPESVYAGVSDTLTAVSNEDMQLLTEAALFMKLL